MKNYKKIGCLIISICLCSCITTKSPDGTKDKKDKANSQNLQTKEMEEKGFMKGTLISNKSEGCSYILTVEKYTDKLDPINLNDFFKNDIPENVWIKYSSLKMANRCADRRPVSIREVSKRMD